MATLSREITSPRIKKQRLAWLNLTYTYIPARLSTQSTRTDSLFLVCEWASSDHQLLSVSSRFRTNKTERLLSFCNQMFLLELKLLEKTQLQSGRELLNRSDRSLVQPKLEMRSMLQQTARLELKSQVCFSALISAQQLSLTTVLVPSLNLTLLLRDMLVKLSMRFSKKALKSLRWKCLTWINQQPRSS